MPPLRPLTASLESRTPRSHSFARTLVSCNRLSISLSVSQTCTASVSQKMSIVSFEADVKVDFLSEGIEEMDFLSEARSRHQGPERGDILRWL